jgi:hypothetical protein
MADNDCARSGGGCGSGVVEKLKVEKETSRGSRSTQESLKLYSTNRGNAIYADDSAAT